MWKCAFFVLGRELVRIKKGGVGEGRLIPKSTALGLYLIQPRKGETNETAQKGRKAKCGTNNNNKNNKENKKVVVLSFAFFVCVFFG